MPLTTSQSLSVERGNPSVPPAVWSELPRDQCSNSNGSFRLTSIVQHFLRQGRLRNEDALDIARKAMLLLRTEPNVLALEDATTVVGDIHGQFYDLAKIFALGRLLDGKQYLFLGDYVGGGGFSCECILLLLAAKVTYPKSVFMLRGAHESRFMTSLFSFEEECVRKYSKTLYNALLQAFNCLPLAATVIKKYFCVHGGLSPDISRIEDIQLIHRFREIPSKGAMCDLIMSDPYWDVENPDSSSTKQRSDYYTPGTSAYDVSPTFFTNEKRRCSFLFNFACVIHFLKQNKLLSVIRSHEVQDEGYRLYRAHPNTNFPSMISVFSAPNYCDTFDNKGAFISISAEKLELAQFFCSPHPIVLHSMNGLSWSLPFVMDNVRLIFDSMLNPIDDGKERAR